MTSMTAPERPSLMLAAAGIVPPVAASAHRRRIRMEDKPPKTYHTVAALRTRIVDLIRDTGDASTTEIASFFGIGRRLAETVLNSLQRDRLLELALVKRPSGIQARWRLPQ